jgi:DNA-directed RNA polymerase
MSDERKRRYLRQSDEARVAVFGGKLDNGISPDEWKRAAEKVERQQGGIADAEGFGATAPAQAIARKWLPDLAQGIQRALVVRTRSQLYVEFFALIRGLNPEVLALCVLQTALNSIGQKDKYRDTALNVGAAIAGECWAAELTKHAPDLAKRIERRVRQEHSSSKRRQQAARAQAARAGYRTRDWSTELRLQAGSWALDQLLTILAKVFVAIDERQEKGGPQKVLSLTPAAETYTHDVIADLIRRNPVWLPGTKGPPRWTDWDKGGTSDKRLSLSLCVMRSHNKRTAAAVRDAIRKKVMSPALDALNALQSTAWTINRQVLDVLHASTERGIAIPGLPSMTDIPAPDLPAAWRNMTPDQKLLLRLQAEKVEKKNRRNLSNRVLLRQDLETADMLLEHDRFWTSMNLDWRGRVYGVPNFNFQRDDRVRALFLFADGEPIGDEGLYWLKVHAANCGDFSKISKQPFDERVRMGKRKP